MATAKELAQKGILTFDALEASIGDHIAFVIDELLVENSINILAGDSGIGKTPLCITMALAIAGGIPFIGMGVPAPKRVLYCDAESTKESFHEVVLTVSKNMGFKDVPKNFHVWSPNWDQSLQSIQYAEALFNRIELFKPDMVFIDPLRIFFPDADTKREAALKHIKKMRQSNGGNSSFLIVHHTRKPNVDPNKQPPAIDEDPHKWFHEVAGQHALINHVDTRLGLEQTPTRVNSELTMAGFVRLRGPIAPIYLTRSRNSDGDPVGYERANSFNLLKVEHRKVFTDLPEAEWFTFTDVKAALESSDAVASRFLAKCTSIGLLEKAKGKGYKKVT